MKSNKNKFNSSNSIKINDLIQIGLMAAIIFVATSLIHIPSFMGVIHLGDSMVFVGAIILGRKKGAISAGIGMMFFDILHGYTTWAPFTFIIKGTMGYIVGTIAYRNNSKGYNFKNNLLGCIVGGIFMISAYYVFGALIAKFILFRTANLSGAFIIALKDIPGNIAQAIGGTLVGLPISSPIKKAMKSVKING